MNPNIGFTHLKVSAHLMDVLHKKIPWLLSW